MRRGGIEVERGENLAAHVLVGSGNEPSLALERVRPQDVPDSSIAGRRQTDLLAPRADVVVLKRRVETGREEGVVRVGVAAGTQREKTRPRARHESVRGQTEAVQVALGVVRVVEAVEGDEMVHRAVGAGQPQLPGRRLEVELEREVEQVAVVEAGDVRLRRDDPVGDVDLRGRGDERDPGRLKQRTGEVRGAAFTSVGERPEVQVGTLADIPVGPKASGRVFEVVDRLARERVLDQAVRPGVGDAAAQRKAVARRAAQGHGSVGGVSVADAQTSRTGTLSLRPPRRDVDRAGDGVPSVERPLRASQDLDLLDVEELLVELERTGEQNPVDRDGYRRLAVPDLADAANVDRDVARVLRVGDRHVRRQTDEVGRPAHRRALDRFRREGRHRDRRLLQILFPSARRDHDRLAHDRRLLRRGLLFFPGLLGRRGSRQHDRQTQRQQTESALLHVLHVHRISSSQSVGYGETRELY